MAIADLANEEILGLQTKARSCLGPAVVVEKYVLLNVLDELLRRRSGGAPPIEESES